MFKKKSCDHEWFKTLQRTETYYYNTGCSVDCDDYDVVYIYCPKCRTRKTMSPQEWDVLNVEQQIQREYYS